MSKAGNYLQDAICRWIANDTPITAPTTVYLRLFTGSSGFNVDTGAGGTDVTDQFANASGGAEPGLAITFASYTNGDGELTNAELACGAASSAVTDMDGWKLYDGDGAGANFLTSGTFTQLSVASGSTFTLEAGAITIDPE